MHTPRKKLTLKTKRVAMAHWSIMVKVACRLDGHVCECHAAKVHGRSRLRSRMIPVTLGMFAPPQPLAELHCLCLTALAIAPLIRLDNVQR